MKENAEKLTGDKKLETEGKFDKTKAEAHQASGNAKDAVRKASQRVSTSDEWKQQP